MARLFKRNKSNETKTPSLETSRFAKSTLLKRKGKLLKGNRMRKTPPENGRGKLLKRNGKKKSET